MVKRRLEIQLVAHGHSGNISGILGAICEDINNAPRQWREGHTPVELLTMSSAQRKEVNARSMKKRRHYTHAEAYKSKAKEVYVGTSVRRILWTTKDIKTRPMGKKGYMEKWSRTIYKVLKIITQRNAVKKYKLDDGISRLYFRTEIQKVVHVDAGVPRTTRTSCLTTSINRQRTSRRRLDALRAAGRSTGSGSGSGSGTTTTAGETTPLLSRCPKTPRASPTTGTTASRTRTAASPARSSYQTTTTGRRFTI